MDHPEAIFRRFLCLDESVEATMKCLGPLMVPQVPGIVEAFYRHIEALPEAMAVFRGGQAQIQRQRGFLAGWLTELFTPPYDHAYVENRRSVGIVHLNAGVDERMMIASMNWLRSAMRVALDRSQLPEGITPQKAQETLGMVLDFDLGIILNSYWTDLRNRTLRIDRLALIGQFTAAINHELRNPLGVINTSAWLLRQKIGASSPTDVVGHLDKIDKSVQRANAIVSGLLRLMRIQEPARNQVDVEAFVREVVSEIRHPEGVLLQVMPGECRSPGSFDKDQMRQVLQNLLDNAVEAVGQAGRIEVRWASDAISTSISIRDDGPGVPDEVRRRIFEPLYTTKAFGTGLGLTLAKAIVESHGGALTMSAVERGACFEIRVPHFLVPQATYRPSSESIQEST